MLKRHRVDFETNNPLEKAKRLPLEASRSLPEPNEAEKTLQVLLEDTVKYRCREI